MNVVTGDVAARIAAIQQMAARLNAGPQPTGNFAEALTAAQDTGGTQAVKATGGDVSGMPYAAEINAAAAKHGIDPALLAGLVKQESGFNPNARSAAGAGGLTQLMPATAKSLGVTDVTDPAQALDGGAKYLRQMLDKFGGDERLALAAYNAGPGAVTRFGGIPPYAETKAYVEKVLANRDGFVTSAVTSTTTAGSAAGALGGAPVTSSNLSIDSSSSTPSYGSSSPLGYPTT